MGIKIVNKQVIDYGKRCETVDHFDSNTYFKYKEKYTFSIIENTALQRSLSDKLDNSPLDKLAIPCWVAEAFEGGLGDAIACDVLTNNKYSVRNADYRNVLDYSCFLELDVSDDKFGRKCHMLGIETRLVLDVHLVLVPLHRATSGDAEFEAHYIVCNLDGMKVQSFTEEFFSKLDASLALE